MPNGRRVQLKGAAVHQIDDLASHHVLDVDGLPMACPARALVDISASYGKSHLGRVLDELIRARKVTDTQVSACLADVARKGKPGTSTLGSLLDERGPGHVPPQSELERRLFELITRARLPAPVRQFPLPGRHPGAEFADAAYPDVMVLIEADGRRCHSRVRDFVRDRCRDTEAAEAGWVVLRFTYEQITTAPEWVAARITQVLAMRRAQLCPT